MTCPGRIPRREEPVMEPVIKMKPASLMVSDDLDYQLLSVSLHILETNLDDTSLV